MRRFQLLVSVALVVLLLSPGAQAVGAPRRVKNINPFWKLRL